MSAQDFDFLHGHWRVRHRRLKARLQHCQDWIEFEGRCSAQPLLSGAANVDDNWLDLPDGAYRAATLRAYDAASDQWSIWWLDGRHPLHPLDPPMRGRFEGGEGLFLADDQFEGRPIQVRFIWRVQGTDACHWEQAFSTDGGRSWETNWTMAFERG